MNVDETVRLWGSCQTAKNAAQDRGQDGIESQGEAAKVWNAWADEMLGKRTRIEEAGEWAVEVALFGDLGRNEVTSAWLSEAQVMFESVRFGPSMPDEPDAMINAKDGAAPSSTVKYVGNTADFRGFRFPDAVSFRETKFLGGSWFSEANFFGPTFFSGAVFVGPVSFEGAAFSLVNFGELRDETLGQERAIRTEFRDDCDFTKVTFHGGAWFNKAIFFGKASFDATEFAGFVWFEDVVFSGVAWFTRAIFSVSSAGTLFGNGASFDRATFADEVTFKGANFTDTVSLKGTTFSRGVSFEEAKLTGGAELDGAVFSVRNA